MDQNKVCSFCPRHCAAGRSDSDPGRSFCRSPLLPRVARAGLHHWEEPILSGSRGAGAVFFSGCNLHCVFCQNHEISTGGQGTQLSVARLRQIYRELEAQGAHNLDLVTPTHFLDAVLESLDPAPSVPVVWNSNGYESVDSLKRLEGRVQIFLPDFKYGTEAPAVRYSAAPGYFETAKAAVLEMFRQTGPYEIGEDGLLKRGVLIRHLVLPGQQESTENVLRWIAGTFRPGEVLVSLMRQYLPCGLVSPENYPELNRRLNRGEYLHAEHLLFQLGIEDGFLQDASSARKEFIPLFDGTGVGLEPVGVEEPLGRRE